VDIIEQLIIERAFGPAVAAQYEQGRLPERILAPVAQAATTLSLRFTGREKFQRNYQKDKDLRLAYLLYYLPTNLFKSGFLLNELAAHPDSLLSLPKLRLLDIGAGQGAATLGLLDYFAGTASPPAHLDIVAADLSARPLEDYRWLVTNYMARLGSEKVISYNLETYQVDLERGLPAELGAGFDLIVAANLINELFHSSSTAVESRARWIAEKVGPALAESGSLLIIEPALKDATRALMRLRDLLSNDYGFTIYSPCPATGNCPMLASERDWCHAAIDWKRPAIVAQLDKLTGNRKETLKFSYLILRRDNRRLLDAVSLQPGQELWRIVSDPHSEKGRASIYACGGGQFLPLVRLKRDASQHNAEFGSLERGQLVSLEQAKPHKRELRIEQDTEVDINGLYLTADK
jgi:ribosomal protein RSM22 (predicted rRNA methylase)